MAAEGIITVSLSSWKISREMQEEENRTEQLLLPI